MSESDIVRIRGHVTEDVVRKGTGSEHTGVILTTDAGERLNLVRMGGNPFSDPETRKLIGRFIEAKGYRIGNELRYLSAQEINE